MYVSHHHCWRVDDANVRIIFQTARIGAEKSMWWVNISQIFQLLYTVLIFKKVVCYHKQSY